MVIEMSNQEKDQELDLIILTDEDGKETEFEPVAFLEVEGKEYAVLLPLDGTDEAVVFSIVEDAEGNDTLEPIESDEEFEAVAKAYEALLEEDDEE